MTALDQKEGKLLGRPFKISKSTREISFKKQEHQPHSEQE